VKELKELGFLLSQLLEAGLGFKKMRGEGLCAVQLKASDADLLAASPSEQQGLGPSHNRCTHGRKRSTCKDCGGSFICTHGRKKPIAKTAGAAVFARTAG
jgi:hypothetical protein